MDHDPHKILITDDDRAFRDNLSELLRRKGFLTTKAASGEEALQKLAEERYDVLLVDMVMPGMNGLATITRLRETNKTIKIILITAFATVDSAVEAIKNGADDYIQKPFKTDELIITIKRVLEEARFEIDVRNLNLDYTLHSLSNPIRRKAIHLIGNGDHVRLIDIANDLNIVDHTKVLFHLKKLKEAEIIAQTGDKSYVLTASGRLMLEFLWILSKHIAVFKH